MVNSAILVALATKITNVIFTEAFKEGGKNLGKGVSEQIAQLILTIRKNFKKTGTEKLLIQAEKQPTESNVELVEAELVTQMTEDESFAKKLTELMKQLETANVARQIMMSKVQVKENLEAEDMIQKAKQDSYVEQVMANNLKAKNIKFGNLTQES